MSMSSLAGRAGPGEAAIGTAFERPAAVVDEPVMERAEPGAVVERGGATEGPPSDVVELDAAAPALGERASAGLFEPGGAALGGGPLPGGSADVEDFTLRPEHDRDDLGVTREPTGGVRADLHPGRHRQPRLAQPAFEHVERHGDHPPDGCPAEARLLAVLEAAHRYQPQRVVVASLRAAGVFRTDLAQL